MENSENRLQSVKSIIIIKVPNTKKKLGKG